MCTKNRQQRLNAQEPIALGGYIHELCCPELYHFQMKLLVVTAVLAILVGCGRTTEPAIDIPTTVEATVKTVRSDAATPSATPPPTLAPVPTPGFPTTSASALTGPPANTDGINTETQRYGTGADPDYITLGPKVGGPIWPPYPGKTSIDFEASHAEPILAPVDMVLIGFKNRNAKYRTRDGVRDGPYNDLELCFRSIHPDWSGMAVCSYHMVTSPLLTGHGLNPDCIEDDEWGTSEGKQTEGWIFYETNDAFSSGTVTSATCGGLIGMTVERGGLIGYAGSVGTHAQAPFRFKVPDATVNQMVTNGDTHLHWVQPSSFFYWKCYGPDVAFEPGVLAYPFECGGYKISSPQRDISFKYSR